MINKQELAIALSFIIANAALVSLTSDWFYFKQTINSLQVSDTVSCTVYMKEAYNVFGSICGVNLVDMESVIIYLQALLPINFGMSLIMFFLIAFRRMKRKMIKLVNFIIFSLSLATILIWVVFDKDRLPTDTEEIYYYGAGFWTTVICGIFTLPVWTI